MFSYRWPYHHHHHHHHRVIDVRPGPIDNSCLLVEATSQEQVDTTDSESSQNRNGSSPLLVTPCREVRPGLQENQDYFLVPVLLMDALIVMYGGDPQGKISRFVRVKGASNQTYCDIFPFWISVCWVDEVTGEPLDTPPVIYQQPRSGTFGDLVDEMQVEHSVAAKKGSVGTCIALFPSLCVCVWVCVSSCNDDRFLPRLSSLLFSFVLLLC